MALRQQPCKQGTIFLGKHCGMTLFNQIEPKPREFIMQNENSFENFLYSAMPATGKVRTLAQVLTLSFRGVSNSCKNLMVGLGLKPIAGISSDPVTNCRISPSPIVTSSSDTVTLTAPLSTSSRYWLKLKTICSSTAYLLLPFGLKIGW